MEQSSKDFAALRRKLASGKTLAVAAAEAGMSEDEARAHLTSREEEDNESLRSFADEAMRVSLKVLKKAALEPEMRKVGETYEMGSDRWESTDIKAATELLKAGMAARKMLRTAKSLGNPGEDLFDKEGNPVQTSAWIFKKTD
jgi:hypothetical protein